MGCYEGASGNVHAAQGNLCRTRNVSDFYKDDTDSSNVSLPPNDATPALPSWFTPDSTPILPSHPDFPPSPQSLASRGPRPEELTLGYRHMDPQGPLPRNLYTMGLPLDMAQ